jgi:3-oxoacyl-[acyl-carrier protein] reductase
MGEQTALLLADEGVTVACLDMNSCSHVVSAIEGAGGTAKYWPINLANAQSIKDVAQSVLSHFGGVDILINNAGVAGFCPLNVDDETFEAAWELQLSVNLTSQVRLSRAFLNSLKRNREGRIVNIASTEGLGSSIFNAAYSAAKHGVVGLTKGMALELASQGVTVNCICPGPVRTGMTDLIPEKQKVTFAKRVVPIRRYGLPEEVAHMTVNLCLPSSSFMNGAVIVVDGGVLANNALLPFNLPWDDGSSGMGGK